MLTLLLTIASKAPYLPKDTLFSASDLIPIHIWAHLTQEDKDEFVEYFFRNLGFNNCVLAKPDVPMHAIYRALGPSNTHFIAVTPGATPENLRPEDAITYLEKFF